jgi:4-amino-4-deoxy-L-arabinose transferase-like glycosyltransferase
LTVGARPHRRGYPNRYLLMSIPATNKESLLIAGKAGVSGPLHAPVAPTRPARMRPLNHMRVVWAVLLLYAVIFLCFYPEALTNFDEVSYIRQAAAFATGTNTVDIVDPFTGSHRKELPSDYPPGTSLLMTPFVWLGGWRGAFLLGLVAVVVCVLITAKWIADSGGSPLYALLILGYLPTLVMTRTGMSDVPSACLAAAGLWLFWLGNEGPPWRRLAAGFLAGASICLREPNPILFACFFAGALLRRERHLIALIGGGLAGLACRPIAAALVYGDPLFVKVQFYGFTGHHIPQNLIMYLTAVLVMVPGGLIFALAYRGHRWPELVSTVAIFVGMFIFYNYNAASSGGLKQWMLSLRFLIPLLPILAFAMAHTCPRWCAALTRSMRGERKIAWQNIGRATVTLWLVGVLVMSVLVNWRSDRWGKLHRDFVQALYTHTSPEGPVVVDGPATIKFLNELHGRRMVAQLTGIHIDQIRTLIERYKVVQFVFFDRDDSDYWLSKAQENRSLTAQISTQFILTLALEQKFPGLGVVRIWKVTGRS